MTALTDTERPPPRQATVGSVLGWADRHPLVLFGFLGALVAGL